MAPTVATSKELAGLAFLVAAALCLPARAEEPVPAAPPHHVHELGTDRFKEDGALPEDLDFLRPNPPAGLFYEHAQRGTVFWPALKKRWLYGDDGEHSLELRGGSMAYLGERPWRDGMPVSGGRVGVSYRYHGLFGGVIRPVAGFDLSRNETFGVPGAVRGYRTQVGAVLVPSAGLEVVYRGVGVGMRAGLPLWSSSSESAFYHPQLHGKNKANFDWGRLLNHMIKNVYFIWEDEPKKKK